MAIPVLNDLSFRDGFGLRLGDSDELKLFHNSSGYSYLQTTGGEDFRLLNATNDKDIAFYTTTSSTSSAQLTLYGDTKVSEFAGDVKVTGSIMRGSITTATNASNTHTCTLADNDNFNIAVANAATTIALTVVSADIGKSGIITITNPASVGSLSFVALPSYMLTPSGATINFVTSANAVSVISYYVLATDKVLCNYIGNFA